MKFYHSIYTKDKLIDERNSDEVITLASIAKWFYLGYFLEHKDEILMPLVDKMMIYSSNEAATKLADTFGRDNVQKYVDKTAHIYLYGSKKSLSSGHQNMGSLHEVSKFLYYLAKKHPDIRYRSHIHQILSKSINLKSFEYANKPGSSPAASRYILGDSIIIWGKDPVIVCAMTETVNLPLKRFTLKMYKGMIITVLKKYIREEVAKEVELLLEE